MSGKFITLEGGEGVGKSTQAKALADALRARGIDIVETREPGGSEGAEAIRKLLLEGTSDRWGPRAEALLFAAARADHVEKTILPAIEAGKWVICDRFLDSSMAYQGGAGGLGTDLPDRRAPISSVATAIVPDRTLLLALPPEEAAARAATRDRGEADRIGGRDEAYHARVAASVPDGTIKRPIRARRVSAGIDALGTPEEVTARLIAFG